MTRHRASTGKEQIAEEPTGQPVGPLHFTQFWLDTIAEWENEKGRKAFVALSCTKDVQDAILADPERNRIVDVIDFRYCLMSCLLDSRGFLEVLKCFVACCFYLLCWL